jgi:hypothetical protein
LLNIAITDFDVSVIDNRIPRGTKPQWMDNSHIAFLQNNEDALRNLISLEIYTKEFRVILQGKTLFDFLFSPDGIFLAYSNWDEFSMYIHNFRNGEVNEVDAHVPMEWTRDSKTLLAETEGAGIRIITITDIISIQKPILGGRITNQCFSSDESSIVFVREGSGSATSIIYFNIVSGEQKKLEIPYCCAAGPVWNPNPGRGT